MTIDLNAIHTLIEGDGARSLLLLNGAGQSLRTWDHAVPGLLSAGRVIRFDVPGVGKSPSPGGPYSFEELGQAAMELAVRHGVGDLVVIGHAWGARAAQVIARDFDVAGVVVGSGGGRFPPLAEPEDMRSLYVLDVDDWSRRFERAYCALDFSARDPELANWLFRLVRETPVDRSVVTGAMERSPVDSYWGQFECPTLLLYGADDLVGHSQHAEDLHRLLPDSTLVYIEQAGHFVVAEQGERFAAEVLRWIDEREL
ncbi:MAG: alpha/beta hydrolase [Chloroflexi bacterium]|nr:alpha/beta hydrolase [Chloroflexota bacterium]MCY3587994.1 alpha/beta hydrolase [Chloroflexota bacterium]MCY3685684.1 alpha/beta hydrolase [Chloroflexota bacterium]MDE2708586.1 alpha/beta hydrolase [Chloroflexota bacterium]